MTETPIRWQKHRPMPIWSSTDGVYEIDQQLDRYVLGDEQAPPDDQVSYHRSLESAKRAAQRRHDVREAQRRTGETR